MLPADTKDTLDAMLDSLHLAPSSIALVHSDMSGLPLPQTPTLLSRETIRNQREAWCAFLFEALTTRLGPEGTLVVPTFTYSSTAPGGSFELETTPSEVGPLSEYVRQRPGARRSLHPLFSLSAIGPKAEAIVGNCGRAAFGQGSPWHRLGEFNARIFTLGLPFNKPMTYVHHVEQCFGVAHRFHKILEMPVRANGKPVDGQFLAYLRYRNIDVGPSLLSLEQALRERGVLAEAEWGGRQSSAVDIRDFDDVAYGMLRDDPWAFATRRTVMRISDIVPEDGPFTGEYCAVNMTLENSGPAE